ncbi:MAG: hypothetical protein EU548_04965, partial [Promethearchaeota archaeon]
SRILVIDENGLEVTFEDLLMLFIEYDERIKKSRSNKIITTANLSPVVRNYIEEKGNPIKLVKNYPGEISRQIREERAIFGAADTLKYYFPQFAPISDGNFILLKILEIMASQNDLLSSLIRGFPKGIKLNKTVSINSEIISNFHNYLRDKVEEYNFEYRDIMNELKVFDEDSFATIKLALNRDSVLLSAESEDTNKAKQMIEKLETIILEIKPPSKS